MASTAHSAIWRDGAEPSTTGGTEDIIEFGSTAIVNLGANITNVGFRIPTGIAVNQVPGQINKLQDTGVSGVTIDITGVIADPQGTGIGAVKTLKAWALEAKTVDTTFPKGRFGLRLNDFKGFDMTPTETKGYMLENIEFGREGETLGKATFVITLRFNGAIGSPSGGYYDW
jgi:hypothetical protein